MFTSGTVAPFIYALFQRSGSLKTKYLALFFLALGLRGLYFLELRDSALFAVLLGDGRQYYAWATEIAAGDWLGREVFYQAPFYPYSMAVMMTLFGPETWPLRILQALLGASSCVLTAVAGSRFFDPKTGLLAGGMLAVYPPAIFFDGLIQKTSLGLFLTTAVLALLAESAQRPRPRWWLLVGVALGCLVLTRENALILTPVLLLWILLGDSRAAWRERRGRVALFGVGLAVILAPVGLRNLAVGGHFHLTTSQLGSNFYIGNHQDADGKYRPLRPGREDARVERRDAVELAEADLGRTLTASEVSSYWLQRSWRYIRSHPVDWLQLLARKAFMVVNARELVDTESLEVYRDHSRILKIPSFFFHFGVLGPLAILGAWATRRDRQRLWILYAIALAIAASLVIFYVVARYRHQLTPIVVLFAAAGIVALVGAVRSRSLRALGPGLALLVLAAVVQNQPAYALTSPRATTYYNLGVSLFEQGDTARARSYLEKTLEILPDFADGHFSLGRVLAAQGQTGDAIERFQQALESDPRHARAHYQLGYLLMVDRQLEAAAGHLARAADLDHRDAISRNLLGNIRAQQGRSAQAARHYQAALAIDPALTDARFKLGLLLAEAGSLDQSRTHLEETTRQLPDYPDAHLRLAEVLERLGEKDQAVREYRRTLELRPNDAEAARRLDRLLTP